MENIKNMEKQFINMSLNNIIHTNISIINSVNSVNSVKYELITIPSIYGEIYNNIIIAEEIYIVMKILNTRVYNFQNIINTLSSTDINQAKDYFILLQTTFFHKEESYSEINYIQKQTLYIKKTQKYLKKMCSGILNHNTQAHTYYDLLMIQYLLYGNSTRLLYPLCNYTNIQNDEWNNNKKIIILNFK